MQCVVLFAASASTLIQFTQTDLTALQTLGCEIHMICNLQQPAVSPAALHEYNLKFPKLIWHDIPFDDNLLALRQNRRMSGKLQQLLAELKPNLLHCHGTIAGIYGRAAAEKLHIPVFYTAHDFRVFHGCRLAERMVFAPLERRRSRSTKVLFPVCPEDASYAKKHLHAEIVAEQPDFTLDYAYYTAPQRTAAEIRKELGIPENATVLLSVGTLRMHKRFRIVIQAMARLRDLEQLHYILCGDGPDMLFLQKLSQKLHLTDRVHLVGYRTDIPDLLGAADIFCQPSRREGCGAAALEAMAAGLPLITTRVHGTKTYAADGESACCLKGDLVAACAEAIQQLYDNKLLRKQMGAHNRAAAKAFSDKNRMMQIRELYRKVLQGS